jgi:hypothetical protein
MSNSNTAFQIGRYPLEETHLATTNTVPPATKTMDRVSSPPQGLIDRNPIPPGQSPWFTSEELSEGIPVGAAQVGRTTSLANGGLADQPSHRIPPMINTSPGEVGNTISSSSRTLNLARNGNEQSDLDNKILFPPKLSSPMRQKSTGQALKRKRMPRGRRHGRLQEQVRKKASEVKKCGACIRCSRLKMAVR